MKENILGYAVDTHTTLSCTDSIFSAIQAQPIGRCAWLACLNPHSYSVSLDDAVFSDALRRADWLIPDGVGIVLASKLMGGVIRERVTGSDVFAGLHNRMNSTGDMSVFFLGATEDTLKEIRIRMATDYPSIRVAGTYSPPFKPDYSEQELDDMIGAINLVRPDVLWVGMTAPKQEKWLLKNHHKLEVKFAGAVGAVFDFYAGRVKRSSPVFQRLGLEWLPRLLQQPRRLWRRVFISAPIFLFHVLMEKYRYRK